MRDRRPILDYTVDLDLFFRFMEEKEYAHWNQIKRQDVGAFVEFVLGRKHHHTDKPLRDASHYKVFRTVRALFNWIENDEDCREEEMHGFRRQLPKIPRNPSKLVVPSPDGRHSLLTL